MTNSHLQAAKSAKNDEFYTQISDIEEEFCKPIVNGNHKYARILIRAKKGVEF